MLWFGKSWGAPVCTPETHIELDRPRTCSGCDVVLHDGDNGVALPYLEHEGFTKWIYYHLHCFWKTLGIDKDAKMLRERK